MRSIRTAFVGFILGLLLTTLSKPALPSVEIAEDRGAAGLAQALKRLDIVGSVLHTGAHPDDENSALLAWLARGQGVRTAYLSATRGEGGVNLLGGELFEALGVIRTEELYGARRLDHAQHFFSPKYEFGFSKSADDTFTCRTTQCWELFVSLDGDIPPHAKPVQSERFSSRYQGGASGTATN